MTGLRASSAVAACAVALLLGLAACTSGGGSDESTAEGGVAATDAGGDADAGGDTASAEGGAAKADPAVLQTEVIQTADLAVRTKDVDGARDRARVVVTGAGGVVSAEQTSAPDDGDVRESVLTLRVPAARFAGVLDQLADLGTLQHQETATEDVSLQVVDVDTRVRSAERAIVRLRALLDRAASLSDVVNLENELAKREADLEALQGQQAYLRDQTSQSTITLQLVRAGEPRSEQGPSGFVDGLGSGWAALGAVAGFGATTVGLLLPFAVLALVVAVPVWFVVRRLRRGAPPAAAQTPPG